MKSKFYSQELPNTAVLIPKSVWLSREEFNEKDAVRDLFFCSTTLVMSCKKSNKTKNRKKKVITTSALYS